MYDSSEYHETVEYLMRGAPDVIFLGLATLWKVSLVMVSDVNHHGVQKYRYLQRKRILPSTLQRLQDSSSEDQLACQAGHTERW